jgi:hypothetical protein
MTITNIVQNLLDKGHITAEEAIILLKAEIDSNKSLKHSPVFSDLPWVNPAEPVQFPPSTYPTHNPVWYTTSPYCNTNTTNDSMGSGVTEGIKIK